MTDFCNDSPQQEESYFKQICDNLGDCLFIEAVDLSRVYYVSAGYEKISGGDRAAVLVDPQSYFSKIHPDDQERFKKRGADLKPVEYRLILDDGSVRWVSDRFFPIFDPDGVCRRRCGVCSDITAQKKALETIERLSTALQQSADAIVATDKKGFVTIWNEAAESFYGILQDDARGKRFETLVSETQRNDIAQDIYEAEQTNAQGLRIEVEVRFSQWQESDSKESECWRIVRDISARRAVERRISEFQSTVSHELRTPLTAIRGSLILMREGVVDPGSAEGAGLIALSCDSVDRLSRLINDLLDLRKLEAGKLALRKTEIAVVDLLQKTVASLQMMALDKDIYLKTELKDVISVFADEDRLTQILVNLISNAIKFSPAKTTVNIVCETGSANSVKFCVRDAGRGISKSGMERLFEKFEQLDSSDTRSAGGTGLGLTISKALVLEHGGEIGVESDEGAGATFWFTIPNPQADACELCPPGFELQQAT